VWALRGVWWLFEAKVGIADCVSELLTTHAGSRAGYAASGAVADKSALFFPYYVSVASEFFPLRASLVDELFKIMLRKLSVDVCEIELQVRCNNVV
jgi:hypothetical protein